MSHRVRLSDEQKVDWFNSRIQERQSTSPIENEQQLVEFVRVLRRQFKEIYKRDVPGSFIRRLLTNLGVQREHSEGVLRKRDWMFAEMDRNAALRDNKTQMRKAIEAQFGEKILSMVFDELWDEYHSTDDHPEPAVDVDLHGQSAIFPD